MTKELIKDGFNSFKLIQNKPTRKIRFKINLKILRPL